MSFGTDSSSNSYFDHMENKRVNYEPQQMSEEAQINKWGSLFPNQQQGNNFMPSFQMPNHAQQPNSLAKWQSGIFSNQYDVPSVANNYQSGGQDSALNGFGMSPLSSGPTGMPGANLYNGKEAGFMQKMIGGPDDAGNQHASYGGLALAGLSAGANAYLGMKQYGLAKDSFKQNKKEFQMNWDANKKMTNARLEDRQRMRNADQPGSHKSTADYMAQNGI